MVASVALFPCALLYHRDKALNHVFEWRSKREENPLRLVFVPAMCLHRLIDPDLIEAISLDETPSPFVSRSNANQDRACVALKIAEFLRSDNVARASLRLIGGLPRANAARMASRRFSLCATGAQSTGDFST
jgi:hypothetical protein